MLLSSQHMNMFLQLSSLPLASPLSPNTRPKSLLEKKEEKKPIYLQDPTKQVKERKI